jgi:hypothetical protein
VPSRRSEPSQHQAARVRHGPGVQRTRQQLVNLAEDGPVRGDAIIWAPEALRGMLVNRSWLRTVRACDEVSAAIQASATTSR